MRQRMLRRMSPGRVSSTMLDPKQFAEWLPGRVNKVLAALAGNELKLKMELIDEGAIIDGLQKMANRVALGLVMAALIAAGRDAGRADHQPRPLFPPERTSHAGRVRWDPATLLCARRKIEPCPAGTSSPEPSS